MYLAIEIGGTKLQLAVANADLQVQERFRFAIDQAAGATGICAQIKNTIHNLVQKKDILAIGVGFGGPIDYKTGQIYVSHQIAGWAGFNFIDWLQSIIKVPVFVDNDANVAALGEATQGAGQGFNPVFYLTIGSGIGGGLVVDGQLYHGAKPGEAEVGHIRLDRLGNTLEACCSGWATDQKVKAAILKEPHGILSTLAGNNQKGEAKYLKEAIALGDTAAKNIMAETAGDLAFGLSHVVHLFHPEVIVLGGGLSLIGEYLRAQVEAILPQYVMKAFSPVPAIKLAQLAEDAVPMGALQLAFQQYKKKAYKFSTQDN